VAEYLLGLVRGWGFDASIEEFEALLPTPTVRKLELIAPVRFEAKLQEPTVREDPNSTDVGQLPSYNAYSLGGDITAPLVYVNYGIPADYELLKQQGIDVKGDALSAVIIDKLPFQVPSDPLVSARMARVEREGGSAFSDYQLPHAILRLKQGLGRLIRSRSDRGVLAILDNRLSTKGYGKLFMASLPDYTVTDSVDDLVEFMKEEQPF